MAPQVINLIFETIPECIDLYCLTDLTDEERVKLMTYHGKYNDLTGEENEWINNLLKDRKPVYCSENKEVGPIPIVNGPLIFTGFVL